LLLSGTLIFKNFLKISQSQSKNKEGLFLMKLDRIGWGYDENVCLEVRFGKDDYEVGMMMIEIIFVIDYYENLIWN
jgi:hypothetical protein